MTMRSSRWMALALCAVFFHAGAAMAQAVDVSVTIRADQPGQVINPNIYGQFVEHLGRGVYDYALQGVRVPSLSVSASRAANGALTVSVVNLDPLRASNIEIATVGREIRAATGRVITAASMDARPEFGKADPLRPAQLGRLSVRRNVTSLVAPAKSVIVLTLGP
jgi:alpha-L-arabinofuranosidase